MEQLYIGVDVSKARLDVHVFPAGEAFAVARDGEGVEALCSRLTRLAPAIVAVEATGGFESVVAAGLGAAGLPVVVVNPAQVRSFAKALGRRAKTDAIDAEVIARFAEATKPAIRPLPDEETARLADLVARRRQIIQMIVAEKQREKRAALSINLTPPGRYRISPPERARTWLTRVAAGKRNSAGTPMKRPFSSCHARLNPG